MINLGTVDPGSTIYIPFESFASSTGAPITITGLATSDIQVYKDGGTTQRASASGFTLLDTDGIDFDGITGIHGFSINLADNTTADFWAAGSRYFVVVNAITVDSQTMSFIAAEFRIGKSGALLDTTIATLASQTSFTLTSGPAEDDALNGHWAIIHDAASAAQFARVLILDYTGSTKTVTLAAGATFTVAAKDNFSLMGIAPLVSQDMRYGLNINNQGDLAGDIGGNINGNVAGRVIGGGATPFSAAGVWAVNGAAEDALAKDATAQSILLDTDELQTDWANGGRLDLLIDLILGDSNELQTDWVNGGRLDLLIDAIKAKTDTIPTFPSNFAALGINASGHVSRVTLVDTTTTATTTTTLTNLPAITANWLTAAGVSSDVWAELFAATLPAGNVGEFGNTVTAAAAYAVLAATDTAAILVDTGTTLQAELDGIQSTIGAAGAGLTAVSLASTGLDAISTTAPSGVASNFREMVVQTWRRFFKRVTKDSDEIKTYADNGSTVLTTQPYTSVDPDDDVGAAS